jgi:hypothetical protein
LNIRAGQIRTARVVDHQHGLAGFGNAQCCRRFAHFAKLAERVLEIAPTDIAISLCLLRATQSAHGDLVGDLVGHQVLERIQHRFMAELGEVPPAFKNALLSVA